MLKCGQGSCEFLKYNREKKSHVITNLQGQEARRFEVCHYIWHLIY